MSVGSDDSVRQVLLKGRSVSNTGMLLERQDGKDLDNLRRWDSWPYSLELLGRVDSGLLVGVIFVGIRWCLSGESLEFRRVFFGGSRRLPLDSADCNGSVRTGVGAGVQSDLLKDAIRSSCCGWRDVNPTVMMVWILSYFGCKSSLILHGKRIPRISEVLPTINSVYCSSKYLCYSKNSGKIK